MNTLLWRRLAKNYLSVAGAIAVLLLIVAALFGPILTPYEPFEINLKERLLSPSWSHIFGTDNFGRDILSRVVAFGY